MPPKVSSEESPGSGCEESSWGMSSADSAGVVAVLLEQQAALLNAVLHFTTDAATHGEGTGTAVPAGCDCVHSGFWVFF